MGFFGNLIGKKLADGKQELKKIENRDMMEAIVGGCLLVAAADGEISDDELLALDSQISANESLSHFGAEIGKVMNRFEAQLKTGFRIGKMKILREIGDIKSNPEEAEEVFVNMLTIAESDGEIDAGELAVLKEVGGKLGIRLADYGLES